VLVDVADGSKVKQTFSPKAWHEATADIVVCRERCLGGDPCARGDVVQQGQGLIRDRNLLAYASTMPKQ